MNERIKQLAEQARAEVRADWAKGNKIPYPEAHYAFQRDNDQKFAELIVRECAGIADGLSKLYPRTDVGFDVGYTMGTTRATKEIKEHFGVKE
jgi:hypothetical protein